MRTSLVLIALLFAFQTSDVCGVEVERLSDRVVMVTGGTWGSNLTAISTGEEIVIIDTFDTPASTGDALEAVRKAFPGLPVRFVVNTHAHDDHVWGNELLADRAIIGHRKTWEYMRKRMEDLVPFFSGERLLELEAELAATPFDAAEDRAQLQERVRSVREAWETWGRVRITPPNVIVESDLVLHLNGLRIEIFFPGPAHSEGDLVVHVPAEELLIVGDLVGDPNEMRALDGEQGSVVGWLAALESLDERFSGRIRHLVRGHGELGDMEMLRKSRVYLDYLVAEVSTSRKRGWTLEEAKERLTLKPLSELESFEELRENNIEATWLSLETGSGSKIE